MTVVTADKTGGSPPSGNTSRAEEQPARHIHKAEAKDRTPHPTLEPLTRANEDTPQINLGTNTDSAVRREKRSTHSGPPCAKGLRQKRIISMIKIRWAASRHQLSLANRLVSSFTLPRLSTALRKSRQPGDGWSARSHTTLRWRNSAISSLPKPNSASTSSVCSPKSGGRAAMVLGVRDSVTGWPTS